MDEVIIIASGCRSTGRYLSINVINTIAKIEESIDVDYGYGYRQRVRSSKQDKSNNNC